MLCIIKRMISIWMFLNSSCLLAQSMEHDGLLSLPPTDQARVQVTDRVWSSEGGDAEVCLWKDDKLVAFTLTIDDNHAQDHEFWLSLGEATGWKWTWFVITGKVGTPGPWGVWDDFRKLAAAGHDIQSHSVMHVDPRQSVPLTVEQEYVESQAQIEKEIPNTRCLVMAYPNGYKPPNDDVLAAKTYIACRGVMGHPNKVSTLNYRDVNSLSGALGFLEPETHWASFRSTLNPTNRQKFRTWYSCHFHGLNHELKTQLNDMMTYLKSVEEDVWVTTFREAALYAQSRDTATLSKVRVNDDEMVFVLSDEMPDEVYDYPLSMKVRLPDSWEGAGAKQNGVSVPVKIQDYAGALYAFVDAVPDRGEIVISPAEANTSDIMAKAFVPIALEAPLNARKEELDETGQPVLIPGDWELEAAQPKPPLEQIIGKPGAGGLIYGLYSWAEEYHARRDSIEKVGWKAIRFAGPIDDRIVKAVADDGVSVMVTLNTRLLDVKKGKDRTNYESDEAFIEDYISHVIAFLDRYGPGGALFSENPELPNNPITDIEIWNEPNFHYLIPPDGRTRVEVETEREVLYAKMLPSVYKAIKAAHPSVTVVAIAAGGMSAGDLRFIDHLHTIDPDLPKYYDVLSTHPYVRPAPPEANSIQPWGSYSIARGLEFIRNVLRGVDAGDKPIWYTELGWPIAKETGGRFLTPADKAFVTPRLQAAYVCRTYAWALRLGVERVHTMFIHDADGFNGGFFLKDGTWRPSAYAVQTMIDVMPNPRLMGAISDGEDGYYAYRFQSGVEGRDVIMAWNVAGPKTVDIDIDAQNVTVTSMLGEVVDAPVMYGKLNLNIGPCPVYVSLPGRP